MFEQNIKISEELKQRARTLALENTTVYNRQGNVSLRNMKKIVKQLEDYSHESEVDENAGFPLLPAMEWLMDHVSLFKEQYLHVERILPNLSIDVYPNGMPNPHKPALQLS